MPTIFQNTSAIVPANNAGEVTTVTRYVSIGGFIDLGLGNIRLNNLGTILDLGVILQGSSDSFMNYKYGVVFCVGTAVQVDKLFDGGPALGVKINNSGEITSTNGYAIHFDGGSSGSIVNTSQINAEASAAIYSDASPITKIQNYGSLTGSEGIRLEGKVFNTEIVNTGKITADGYSIVTKSGATFSLNNSGVISGTILADTVNGIDTVTNSGRVLDNLNLGSGSDTYTGTGTGYAFRVYGDAGVDRLTGSSAADVFYGGSENDVLNGGGGNDQLIGGTGSDKLQGGVGRDLFIFNTVSDSTAASSGRDTILDFVHGQDRINLAAIDANGAAAGSGVFKFIAAEGAAFVSGVAGQIRWDQVDAAGTASDRTYVYADLDGNRTIDFAIALVGLHTLTATDFLL